VGKIFHFAEGNLLVKNKVCKISHFAVGNLFVKKICFPQWLSVIYFFANLKIIEIGHVSSADFYRDGKSTPFWEKIFANYYKYDKITDFANSFHK
jgi:hypothetical protein